MFTADEVSSVVDLAKLKELKNRGSSSSFFAQMTLDEITGIDKELIAPRYEAAITETSIPAGSIAESTALYFGIGETAC
jgi:hypothetical protein